MGKSIKFKDGKGYVYVYPYFPVGSIYLSVNNTNPSTYFDGTWELVAKGKTLVGVDTSDSDFNTAKKTGGEKTHTLTIDELAKHKHNLSVATSLKSSGSGYYALLKEEGWAIDPAHSINGTVTSIVGGDQPHNNMPPYFTCYIWLKTAL